MGQNNSTLGELSNLLPDTINTLNLELRSKAQVLQEINSLTREDFDNYLRELNDLSSNCLFDQGRQMVFAVKNDTVTNSFLWKVTIRINCIKFDPETKRIDTITTINLRQFIQLFRTFQNHLEMLISTENHQNFDQNLLEEACATSTTSSLEEEILNEECCICLDRKPDLILPCLHLFCESCIEQWNSSNKSCPICQEKLTSTDESWVISDIPDVGEISKEIQDTFLHISEIRDDDDLN